ASVIPDPGVRDTANAFIYRQNPVPKDEEGRSYRIRPGQTIDVWLSVDRPNIDSLEGNFPRPDSLDTDGTPN
ncbi:MAG TPA: penicillin-binding protein, partial [Flavisolibacter sp.]